MAKDFKVEGLDSWSKWVDSIPIKVEKKVEKHVATTAYKIEANAKRLVPVDTGHLRRSIQTELDKVLNKSYTAVVGTNIEYAPYIEFGTIQRHPKPYLIPSLDKYKQAFIKGMEDIAKGIGD